MVTASSVCSAYCCSFLWTQQAPAKNYHTQIVVAPPYGVTISRHLIPELIFLELVSVRISPIDAQPTWLPLASSLIFVHAWCILLRLISGKDTQLPPDTESNISALA